MRPQLVMPRPAFLGCGYVEKFGFIIGVQRRMFRDQDPVNIEASELIARLHDALKASGYDGQDLELFLVRTVFCLFADDTGIFEPRDIFLQFIEERTAPDGADLGAWLMLALRGSEHAAEPASAGA